MRLSLAPKMKAVYFKKNKRAVFVKLEEDLLIVFVAYFLVCLYIAAGL